MSAKIAWQLALLLPLPSLLASCSYPDLPQLAQHEADAGPDAPLVAEGPASCRDLADTCGPGGTDDCCTSLEVPGGTFFRSFDYAGDALSGNTDFPATVSSFRLDKYEVTVGRFRAFVAAGMGTQVQPPMNGAGAHAVIPNSGWDSQWNAELPVDQSALLSDAKCSGTFATWTDSVGANETRPINCLTWFEAMAFCIWDGGYLPSEAEWNYAAAGGADQRAYPWSVPANNLDLNLGHASYFDGAYCYGDGLPACTPEDLVPVGSKPVGNGRWGHSDLSGNVSEWTLDAYVPYPGVCRDCAQIDATRNPTIRGGAFYVSNSNLLRTAPREAPQVFFQKYYIGFRCARGAE
jgi:formylglycine-generating enzyme